MADPRDDEPPGRSGKPSVTGDLAARIARARAERPEARQEREGQKQADFTGAGRAFRMASEFVAAIVVGAGLGFGIDTIFSTRPWATVILLLLGFAAGVLNVVRATAEMNAATAVPPGTPAASDDEDE